MIAELVPVDAPELGEATVHWEKESFNLTIDIPVPSSVAEKRSDILTKIHESVGLQEDGFLVSFANLNFVETKEHIIRSIDTRLNISRCQQKPIGDISGSRSAMVRLSADYDENGMATIDSFVDFVLDETGSALEIQIRPDASDGQWAQAATNVFFRLTSQYRISHVRITGLTPGGL